MLTAMMQSSAPGIYHAKPTFSDTDQQSNSFYQTESPNYTTSQETRGFHYSVQADGRAHPMQTAMMQSSAPGIYHAKPTFSDTDQQSNSFYQTESLNYTTSQETRGFHYSVQADGRAHPMQTAMMKSSAPGIYHAKATFSDTDQQSNSFYPTESPNYTTSQETRGFHYSVQADGRAHPMQTAMMQSSAPGIYHAKPTFSDTDQQPFSFYQTESPNYTTLQETRGFHYSVQADGRPHPMLTAMMQSSAPGNYHAKPT